VSGPPYDYSEYLPSGTPSKADILALFVDVVGYFSARYGAKQAMDKLTPAITAKMPQVGGVLVGLRYQRREDDEGPRSFMFAWIVGSGADARFVLKNASGDTISQSCWEGFVKEDEYIWISKH